MIKLRLIPLVGSQMTRTYGPDQAEALLARRLPLCSCPHPDKMCWTPNNRRAPGTMSFVREPDSTMHHVPRSSGCAVLGAWNTCLQLPRLLFYWLLVHPWDFSLNISTSGSPPWPPRLSYVPFVCVPTVPPGLEKHQSHWIVTNCLLVYMPSPLQSSMRPSARSALLKSVFLMWSKLLRRCWLDGWINCIPTCLPLRILRYSQRASQLWDCLVFGGRA